MSANIGRADGVRIRMLFPLPAVANAGALRAALAGHLPRIVLARGATIDVSDAPLLVPDGTTVEGDGTATIEVGRNHDAGHPGAITDGDGIRLLGRVTLRGVRIRNRNAGPTPCFVVRGNWGAPLGNDGTVLDRCDIDLGEGYSLDLRPSRGVVVRDCTIRSESATVQPLDWSGQREATFVRNRVFWRTGYANFQFWTDSTISDNEFHLDGAFRQKGRPQSGGVGLTYSRDTLFARNHIVQDGGEIVDNGDDEMLGAEAGPVPEWQGSGTVVATVGTALETTARWGSDPWYAPAYPRTQRRACYVLSGRAAGQWRWCEPGARDGTVALERPFSPAPVPGDAVSLGSVPAYRLTLKDNIVRKGHVGVQFWCGALECVVEGNALYDAGGIVLFALSGKSRRTPRSGFEHFPIWDTVVRGNLVVAGEGRAAAICAYATDVSHTELPLALKGLELSGNRFSGTGIRSMTNPFERGGDGVSVTSVDETGAAPSAARVSAVARIGNVVVTRPRLGGPG